jgi:hypothetical protein
MGHLEATREMIRELQKTVEGLRSEADIQLRRIADLQAQLDVTLGEFRHLREIDGENPRVRAPRRN